MAPKDNKCNQLDKCKSCIIKTVFYLLFYDILHSDVCKVHFISSIITLQDKIIIFGHFINWLVIRSSNITYIKMILKESTDKIMIIWIMFFAWVWISIRTCKYCKWRKQKCIAVLVEWLESDQFNHTRNPCYIIFVCIVSGFQTRKVCRLAEILLFQLVSRLLLRIQKSLLERTP